MLDLITGYASQQQQGLDSMYWRTTWDYDGS